MTRDNDHAWEGCIAQTSDTAQSLVCRLQQSYKRLGISPKFLTDTHGAQHPLFPELVTGDHQLCDLSLLLPPIWSETSVRPIWFAAIVQYREWRILIKHRV